MQLGPLILDLQSTRLRPEEKDLLLSPYTGGVIFFARNFECKSQLMDLIGEVRQLRGDLLLAVDQEGGRVQRFKEGFTRLPPMQAFYTLYQKVPERALALAENTGWLMAAELLATGLDFSFAPVLDVDNNRCAVIADRAFAPEPDAVIDLAGAFIRGLHAAGMAATGKHFPGHGSVSGDSHLVRPVDDRSWKEIEATDLRPFKMLSTQLQAVMPAHITFPAVDSQPVGFSSVWLREVLRQELGFEGVIFSDDLSMKGASGAGGYAKRAEKALTAGCDMVLACNNQAGALEILRWLERENFPASTRLSSMAGSTRWNWDSLGRQSRWQETVEQLATMGSC
mgnify:CR=1 FL=1